MFSPVKFNFKCRTQICLRNLVSRKLFCFFFLLWFLVFSLWRKSCAWRELRQTSILCADTLFIANEFIHSRLVLHEYNEQTEDNSIRFLVLHLRLCIHSYIRSFIRYSSVNVHEITLFAWDSHCVSVPWTKWIKDNKETYKVVRSANKVWLRIQLACFFLG